MYARNILTRLDTIVNPTTSFTSDIVRQSSNNNANTSDGEMNMGLLMIGVMMVMFLVMALLKKKQVKPVSKLE